jgi:Zn-dependent M28 family amino/carboxypeptidase
LSTLLALLAAGLLLAYWLLTQPLVSPRASRSPPVDTQRLEAHVRMLSETLYPRSFDQPKQLNAAAAYIKSELAAGGARVEEQIFQVQEATYRNIVAHFGADEGPVLVIGAHYDSFADAIGGARFPKGYDLQTHTPGADDNASGVAGLLELARLLTQAPPKNAVELVAFTLEEPPHFRSEDMGSARHARRLRDAGRAVRLMISLEMIGYFDSTPGSQTYPVPGLGLLYPDRGDFVAVVGRLRDWAAARRVKALMLGASDLPVRSINTFASMPGVDFSDHASYWNEGYSALMVTDTAFFRNPNYHGPRDTAERLDYARMAKVVQGMFALAHDL